MKRTPHLLLALAALAGINSHAMAQDFDITFDGSNFSWPMPTVNPLPVDVYSGGDSSGSITISAGGGGITRTGTGTTTLGGANSYTGVTVTTGGTLILSNPAGLSSGTGVTINSGFDSTGATITLDSGTFTGGDELVTVGAGSLSTISSGASNLTFNGTVLDFGGMSAGSGTLVLSDDGLPLAASIVPSGTVNPSPVDGPKPFEGSGLVVTDLADGPTAPADKMFALVHATGTQADNISIDTKVMAAVVPEPATWAMLLTGLLVLAGWRRAKRA